MSRTLQSTYFKTLKIRLIDQTFEFAGDNNSVEIGIAATTDIPIKSMLTKGSIQFEMPDTNVTTITKSPGAIFPGPNALSQKKFKITALEDDTHIHCVQPLYSEEKIVYTESDLNAGSSLNVSKGQLVFVFGDSYKILDNNYSTFRIFAVQNTDALIQAISDCKVIAFKSI
jgi:hypothetical protein